MKTSRFISRQAIPLALLLSISLVANAENKTLPAKEDGSSRPYTLYMGADLDVKTNNELCRVMDVTDGNFVVQRKTERALVPLEKGNFSFKINHNLKLTEHFATVFKLKIVRAYTAGNDPMKKWNKARDDSMAIQQSRVEQSSTALMYAAASRPGVNPFAQGGATGPVSDTDSKSEAVVSADFQSTINSGSGDVSNAGYYAGRIQEELDKQLFDAVEINFEVSSAETYEHPYLVVVSEFVEKDKPKILNTWVYARPLAPITPKSKSVWMLQGGFPKGFIIEKAQIHLYNNGEEIATNESSKRVMLTNDEAFQYVLLQYLGTNKAADKTAAPAFGHLTNNRRQTLSQEQLKRPLFVKVSKEGKPLEAFSDEQCKKPCEPELLAAVSEFRFTPALTKGKAVEGLARLRLAELPN